MPAVDCLVRLHVVNHRYLGDYLGNSNLPAEVASETKRQQKVHNKNMLNHWNCQLRKY